jgi:hypothetical protein
VLVIRLEWIHAKAALERWKEEILLLWEESRHVAAYFATQRGRWEGRAFAPEPNTNWSEAMDLGYRAFAQSQAAAYVELTAAVEKEYNLVTGNSQLHGVNAFN